MGLADAAAAVNGADEPRHERGNELVAEPAHVEREQCLTQLWQHLAQLADDLGHVGGGVVAHLLHGAPRDARHRLVGARARVRVRVGVRVISSIVPHEG